MSSGCYFSQNKPGTLRNIGTDLTSVACDASTLRVISDCIENLSVPLHGCDSFLDLLYFRGNGENVQEMEHPEKNWICKPHLDFLLLNWPNKSQQPYSYKKSLGLPLCVFPHHEPRVVTSRACTNKSESISWLSATSELIHVGTSICTSHRLNFVKGKINVEKIGKMGRKVPPKRIAPIPEDEADMDYNPAIDTPNPDPPYSSDEEDITEIEPPSNEDFEAVISHFSDIAEILGKPRFKPPRLPWHQLGPDSQYRKISSVSVVMEALCNFVAGCDGAKDLATKVLEKIGAATTNQDDCASQVLSAVSERMINAPHRKDRIEALSLIVDLPYFFSSKILMTIPYVSKYLIHKARLYNRGGVDIDQKFERVRYNPKAVDWFVSFVVRSNVVISLAWINNFATKSDGTRVEMGVSVRLQSYSKIDRMYREDLKKYEKGKEWTLSWGTVYELLKSIIPKKNKRMQCVDEFYVDSGEAWNRMDGFLSSLESMGYLSKTQQSDMARRIKLSRTFLDASYRTHVQIGSTVRQHCATFALSDNKKAAYRQECDHHHDDGCEECEEVDKTVQLVLTTVKNAAEKSKREENADYYKLERMLGMSEKYTSYIRAFKAHIIRQVRVITKKEASLSRAVVSDTEKSKVQESMKNKHGLVTCDWAQKVQPTSAIEAQSGYYAKAGVSVHVTHCYVKFEGRAYHHALIHIFDSSKQMSSDVAAIIRHSAKILEENGVESLTLRSDNAGCYKSADLLGDLSKIANSSPTIDRYLFCEAQAGKGPCDRAASHFKRKLNEHTESRKDAKDAGQIFDALSNSDAVRGTSYYLCSLGKSDHDRSSVPDISTLYDIEFKTDGILSRRHSGMGVGLKTAESKLKPLNSELIVEKSGGHVGGSDFWASLDKEGDEEKEKGEDTVEAENPNSDTTYHCSTPGCLKSFLRLHNLERHEIIGIHKYKSKKQTLLDRAIDTLNRVIETDDVAREERAVDSFKDSAATTNIDYLLTGWALKKNTKDKITDAAYEAAAQYFIEQRTMNPPRRADPRAFSLLMEEMMARGKYKFRANELLSEKQLTGLFSRLEKKRITGVSVARKKKGSKKGPSTSSRKRTIREVASSGDEKENEIEEEEEEEEEEMDDEAMIRECFREKHGDIFK